ncbi:MAG: PKD domain-containing protein, partial [Actinobacteria bacterium]|nr:PKD domain-containing protein [Actinomycetota bacterium]
NNYQDGFQSLPINWAINTPPKRAFFERVLALAGGPNRPPPPPRRNEPPVAAFGVTSTQAPVDVPIGFTSTSHDPDGSIADLLWTWGDNSSGSTQPAASHAYRAAGSYTVTLTVVDNEGARAQASRTVTIDAPPTTSPPTPPTPPAAPPVLPAPAPTIPIVSRGAAPSLSLGGLSVLPQRPQAGGRLRVRMRLNVAGETTARPRIGCEARVRNRALVRLTSRLHANGEVECAWRVPQGTRGRWLWGAVTVSSGEARVRAVFSRRVR